MEYFNDFFQEESPLIYLMVCDKFIEKVGTPEYH